MVEVELAVTVVVLTSVAVFVEMVVTLVVLTTVVVVVALPGYDDAKTVADTTSAAKIIAAETYA
ncbi:MAG TPA: hypothetical protein VND40_05075 [Nitrososphaerales archaeon]|nr:hypothetical protein [Nitrososphaerales archaeon]